MTDRAQACVFPLGLVVVLVGVMVGAIALPVLFGAAENLLVMFAGGVVGGALGGSVLAGSHWLVSGPREVPADD